MNSVSLIVLARTIFGVFVLVHSKEQTKRHLQIQKSIPTQEVHIKHLAYPEDPSRTNYQGDNSYLAPPAGYPFVVQDAIYTKIPSLLIPHPPTPPSGKDIHFRSTPLPTSTPQPPETKTKVRGFLGDTEPQPTVPPLEEIYPPQKSEIDGYYYGAPIIQTDYRPTPTELSRFVNILNNDDASPKTPSRNGRLFYTNHQYVKTVPVIPIYPNNVRNVIRPIVVDEYAPPDPINEQVTVRVSDISCYQTPTRTQFRAVLTPTRRLDNAPVFENRIPNRCETSPQTSEDRKYFIDMNNNLEDCGVQQCSDNGETRLCVALRFPTIRGLKLPEDLLMTIQCRTQDRVVEQSKQLRVNTVGRLESRAAPLVAVGGQRYEFQSQMALYKRPPGGTAFSQRMSAGSSVQLGEEIQLRCDIRSGDGWQFSRLGDVTIHRSSHDGLTTDDSVVLVNPDGCRNPLMKSVCPHHPQRDKLNPLSTSVNWRVFMFQDMREGEEIVVSAHLLGCLENADCDPDLCSERTHLKRARRDAVVGNRTADWRADLSFRVVLPKFDQVLRERNASDEWMLPVFSVLLCLALLAVFLVSLFIFKTFCKTQTQTEKSSEYFNIK